MNKRQAATRRTQKYRDQARASGGIIVYAMITTPEAVEAWKGLKEVFDNNRDLIEDALINSYRQIIGGE
jgi:hypothetical protein